MNIQSKANTAELKASYGHTFTEQLLQVRMLKLVTIPYQTMQQTKSPRGNGTNELKLFKAKKTGLQKRFSCLEDISLSNNTTKTKKCGTACNIS